MPYNDHLRGMAQRRPERLLRIQTVTGRIAADGGTLIIESPSYFGNISRAWWTPENLLNNAPSPLPTHRDYRLAAKSMTCLDWDKWCWENYTSPDCSNAFLVCFRNGASLEAKLSPRFPALKVVRTWTAPVHFTRSSHERIIKPPIDMHAI